MSKAVIGLNRLLKSRTVTVKGTANELGVGVSTLYGWLKKRKVPKIYSKGVNSFLAAYEQDVPTVGHKPPKLSEKMGTDILLEFRELGASDEVLQSVEELLTAKTAYAFAQRKVEKLLTGGTRG